MFRSSLLFLTAALTLAACETTAAHSEKSAALDKEVAAKKGDEVSQICFTSNIGGWRALDRNRLLLRKNIHDWYLLELSGTCDPDLAMNAIGLRTRPSSSPCLSRGDRIETYDTAVGGSCIINRIYEWNDKAPVPDAKADD